MSRIRPFRAGDEPALGEICVRTAADGVDATGMLGDDDIWPAIFAWPYAHRHPDTAFVVETDDARVAGYIVAAVDTDDFEAWFRDHWWPPYARRWPVVSGAPEEAILRYAAERGTQPSPYQRDGYPAHLHIDLLPELQGHGWGRRLVATLVERLRELGVPGVHLSSSERNTGAAAFYPRVGFTPLPAESGRSFGMRL